jgi:hypothetical protein
VGGGDAAKRGAGSDGLQLFGVADQENFGVGALGPTLDAFYSWYAARSKFQSGVFNEKVSCRDLSQDVTTDSSGSEREFGRRVGVALLTRRAGRVQEVRTARPTENGALLRLLCLLLPALGAVQVGMWGDWGDTRGEQAMPNAPYGRWGWSSPPEMVNSCGARKCRAELESRESAAIGA